MVEYSPPPNYTPPPPPKPKRPTYMKKGRKVKKGPPPVPKGHVRHKSITKDIYNKLTPQEQKYVKFFKITLAPWRKGYSVTHKLEYIRDQIRIRKQNLTPPPKVDRSKDLSALRRMIKQAGKRRSKKRKSRKKRTKKRRTRRKRRSTKKRRRTCKKRSRAKPRRK